MRPPPCWALCLAVVGFFCCFLPDVVSALPKGPRKQLPKQPGLFTSARFLSRFKECEQIIERSSLEIRRWFRNCSAASAPPEEPKHDNDGLPSCSKAAGLRKKCVFMSPFHLKHFIKLLDLKYAILGRPRFGKRDGNNGHHMGLALPDATARLHQTLNDDGERLHDTRDHQLEKGFTHQSFSPVMENKVQQPLLLADDLRTGVPALCDNGCSIQQNVSPDILGLVETNNAFDTLRKFENDISPPHLERIVVYPEKDSDEINEEDRVVNGLFRLSS